MDNINDITQGPTDNLESDNVQEANVAALSKYCHNVDCDFYNLPQPYSRTLCFECAEPLFTTKA